MRQLPEGARVKFWHQRLYDSEIPLIALPRGGRTQCSILLPDGQEVIGNARCSKRDNYSKRIGRDISFGRALKILEDATTE